MRRLFQSLFVILFFAGNFTAVAGFRIGGNWSTMGNSYPLNSNTGHKVFYHFGFGSKVNWQHSSFRAELNYSVKGRTYEFSDTVHITDAQSDSYKTNYHDRIPYLDIPLLFTIPVHEKVVVELGPNLAFRVGGKRKGATVVDRYFEGTLFDSFSSSEDASYRDSLAFPNFKQEVQPEGTEEDRLQPRPVKRIDLGLNIGLQVLLGEKLSVVARYNYGLLDAINNSYFNIDASSAREVHQNLEIGIQFFLE